MLKRLYRLAFLAHLFLMEGYARAKLLKKKRYFAKQGENCYFATYNFGTEPELIEFGSNVVVATSVRFITHDMSGNMLSTMLFGDPNRISFRAPIKIGSNVFIGAGVTILPGVTIGNNVIVGAASVVTKDIPSNSVVAGVPAKQISTFAQFVEKNTTKTEKTKYNAIRNLK